MSQKSAVGALAEVAATLVNDYDAVSALTRLVTACGEVLGAHATGLLVAGTEGVGAPGEAPSRLELLASSSHEATELERYQVHIGQGPCLDAVDLDAVVEAVGADEVTRRWPRLARALTDGGVVSVHAAPLRWRGTPFGALNMFFATPRTLDPDEAVAVRAFADVATLAIVHARRLPQVDAIAREVQEALDGRILIEQAKGVVAAQEGLDPGTAFDLLVARARHEVRDLSEVAQEVLDRALHGRYWSEEGAQG